MQILRTDSLISPKIEITKDIINTQKEVIWLIVKTASSGFAS